MRNILLPKSSSTKQRREHRARVREDKYQERSRREAAATISGGSMPWGMHKGKPFTKVPKSYLEWMVEEKHTLSKLAVKELARRARVL